MPAKKQRAAAHCKTNAHRIQAEDRVGKQRKNCENCGKGDATKELCSTDKPDTEGKRPQRSVAKDLKYVLLFCFWPHPDVHAQRGHAFVLVGMDKMCFNVPRLPHETDAVPARVVQKVLNHLRLSRILVFG